MSRTVRLGFLLCALMCAFDVHSHHYGWAAFWSVTAFMMGINQIVLAINAIKRRVDVKSKQV